MIKFTQVFTFHVAGRGHTALFNLVNTLRFVVYNTFCKNENDSK